MDIYVAFITALFTTFDSSFRKVHAETLVQLLQTVFNKTLVSQVDNCFAFVCVCGEGGYVCDSVRKNLMGKIYQSD